MIGLIAKTVLSKVSPASIIALILAGVCFFGGWQIQGWRKDAKIEQLKNTALEAEASASAATAENLRVLMLQEKSRRDRIRLAAELAAERNKEAVIVDRIIETEVIKYVQTENADAVCLDSSGVQLHDKAARGATNGLPGEGEAASPLDGAIGRIEDPASRLL